MTALTPFDHVSTVLPVVMFSLSHGVTQIATGDIVSRQLTMVITHFWNFLWLHPGKQPCPMVKWAVLPRDTMSPVGICVTPWDTENITTGSTVHIHLCTFASNGYASGSSFRDSVSDTCFALKFQKRFDMIFAKCKFFAKSSFGGGGGGRRGGCESDTVFMSSQRSRVKGISGGVGWGGGGGAAWCEWSEANFIFTPEWEKPHRRVRSSISSRGVGSVFYPKAATEQLSMWKGAPSNVGGRLYSVHPISPAFTPQAPKCGDLIVNAKESYQSIVTARDFGFGNVKGGIGLIPSERRKNIDLQFVSWDLRARRVLSLFKNFPNVENQKGAITVQSPWR